MDFIGINQIYKQNIIQNKKVTAEEQKINKSADTTSFAGNFSVLEQLAKNNQCLVKNISFGGNETDFEQRKEKLLSEMEKNDSLKSIKQEYINKYNIQILERVAADKKLYTCEYLMNKIVNILYCTKTPEQVQIVNKVLAHEKLYNNENLMNRICDIAWNAKTPEHVQIVNKVLDDEKLYNNETLVNKIGWILSDTETPEHVQIVNKVLDDEKLYNNEYLMYWINNILESTETSEHVQIINKILADEKLYNCKNIMNNIGSILYSIETPEQVKIVNKVLDNEKLYTYKNLMNNLCDILNSTNSSKKVEIANKVCSNEKLYNNENIMEKLVDILNSTNSSKKVEIAYKVCSNEKLYNNENIMNNLYDILYYTNSLEQANAMISLLDRITLDERLYNCKNLMNNIGWILLCTETPEHLQIINTVLDNEKLYNNKGIMNILGSILGYTNSSEKALIINKVLDNEQTFAIVENQIKQMYEHPELYTNGEPENNTEVLSYFFNKFYADLLIFTELTDKETLDVLMKKRLDNAEEYFYNIRENFTGKDYELFGKLCKSTNQDGKPFMPTNKIEFINLLSAYNQCKVDKSKMYQMVETGKVDIGELNKDLFNKIMLDCGMTEEEISKIPNEKLMTWDLNYIHLLAKEINSKEDEAFEDIIKAGSVEDFMTYIHDKNNVYGQSNAKTKRIFEEQNMNYEKWIKPAKDSEIQFKMKDKNTEQLEQVASQIREDMNSLMQTPVKGFLKKQFPKFIKGDEFVIPNEYLKSKAKLLELVKIFTDETEQGQLSQVWNRAKGNADNPDTIKAQRAANTLTILDHLKQRVQDIEKMKTSNQKTQNLDLTIKMWDRIPQKDIFQGNYSTCCIGMDGENNSAMPHFVLNTSYNMIELVDNSTGKTIGNALCYFVNTNGKPAFIIDNIEINNAHKPSNEVGIQLRDAMAKYASNVAKEVTGKDDIHVYMSHKYNDVPTDDLTSQKQSVTFLGDVDCDESYMDLYNGWVDKNKFTKKCELLKLR